MTQVSAVVITYNEEANLTRCLTSLSWADEIVVVDSGSTDKTLDIARKFNAAIFTRDFDNFASQRNFGAAQAKNAWILAMDADEEIPRTLGSEIGQALTKGGFDAYLMPRRNIIFGREIKHTRWSPDKHIWLYDKTKAKWVGDIHEEVQVRGKVGELAVAKIHHSHKSVAEFITMLNSYTDKEAELQVKNGIRFSLVRMLFDSLRSFVGRFIYKQGFLDGLYGFVLSCLMAFYRMVTWMKVWEKQNV